MNVFGILVIIGALGSLAAFVLRKKQELALITKLPADEARAFHAAIVKRDRRARLILVGVAAVVFLGFMALFVRGA